MTARSGAIVAWWDGGSLALGVVVGEEKSRIRLVRGNAREERVRENRILAELERGEPVPDGTPESRRVAGERVRAAEIALREAAAEIDVSLVWSLVRESEQETTTAAELADLALGETGGRAVAAVVVALLDDGLHFFRKGDGWETRAGERVAGLRLEREQQARRLIETEELHDALRRALAGEGWTSPGSDTETRVLHALEETAIHEEEAPDAMQRMTRETLEASGLRHDRVHEGAFRLLRATERFASDDENLQIRRFGLREEFSGDVLEAARQLAAGPVPSAVRDDWTELRTLSIDSPSTREIDDAISAAPHGDGWRIWIHIADPAAWIRPGDAVDAEALERGLTHYFPDRRLTMLPPGLAEARASLVEGEVRPALTFRVELDAAGEPVAHTVGRSWIRSDMRMSYAEADRALAVGEDGLLRTLAEIARVREAARGRSGALHLRQPDVDVKVDPDGNVYLECLAACSTARSIVTESMVLAGWTAARVAAETGVSIIHRRQPPPMSPIEVPPEGVEDPVRLRAILRTLQRADAGIEPAPHHALGLQAYAQATSPLRRFQDLATHRQLAAASSGEGPPYDEESMRRISAHTERAESAARKAERACNAYWMLRYLQRRQGEQVSGTVIDTEPRPLVQLDETRWTQPVPALAGAELGEQVELRVERVNPRAGLLVLRRPGHQR